MDDETYYYAQVYPTNYCIAFGGMTYAELKHVVSQYNKDITKKGVVYNTVFGKTKDLYMLGEFGDRIRNNMKSYKADVMQLIINTTEYYMENPDDVYDMEEDE